jgi:hypothetical protein
MEKLESKRAACGKYASSTFFRKMHGAALLVVQIGKADALAADSGLVATTQDQLKALTLLSKQVEEMVKDGATPRTAAEHGDLLVCTFGAVQSLSISSLKLPCSPDSCHARLKKQAFFVIRYPCPISCRCHCCRRPRRLICFFCCCCCRACCQQTQILSCRCAMPS